MNAELPEKPEHAGKASSLELNPVPLSPVFSGSSGPSAFRLLRAKKERGMNAELPEKPEHAGKASSLELNPVPLSPVFSGSSGPSAFRLLRASVSLWELPLLCPLLLSPTA